MKEYSEELYFSLVTGLEPEATEGEAESQVLEDASDVDEAKRAC
jgi:hypothetical protein